MGWHYILEVSCVIRPEFLDFFKRNYIEMFAEYEDIYTKEPVPCECTDSATCFCHNVPAYAQISKAYRDLVDIWISLGIGRYTSEYCVKDATLRFEITKKVTRHRGDLWQDMLSFVKDILVPATTEITRCKLSSDDYGDTTREYTDLELRGGRLDLASLVRCVEHVWEEGAIAETRVRYKRGIPANQQRDLERLYGT